METTTAERETVNRPELAKLLGISPKTLDRHRDELPSPIRIGRRLVWSRAAVLDYLRGRKPATSSATT